MNNASNRSRLHRQLGTVTLALLGAAGCASVGTDERAVQVGAYGPNPVSVWDQVGHATANAAPSPNGATPEERRPGPDVATLHIAIYDAVIAIAGTHQPFAIKPKAPVQGASMEAAAHEAAYRVLKGLFPSRSATYQATYDSGMAAIAAGDAKTRGAAVGAEVAAGVLALRAHDGRSVALPPYVPGSGPGQFRGTNPINQIGPHLRPFAMHSAAQFRPARPPELTSARYARDLQEVREFAAANATRRSAAQTEVARFYTEPPPPYWGRNLRRFASANANLADNARLMAMISVAYQDAIIGCFDAKYAYNFWRPTSAVHFAAVQPDPGWAAFLPTPNHPEYPSAHACAHGALAQTLEAFYGTSRVGFEFDSTVTGTSRRYARTSDILDEVNDARVWGGMHFRFSNEAGTELGRQAARWMLGRHFAPLPARGE
jgi:hypothetical protein